MENIKKLLTICILSLFLISMMTPVLGTQESNDDIVFDFTFSKPQIEKITYEGETYNRITIDGLENNFKLGAPSLPVKPLKILLPQGKDLEDIGISASGKTTLGYGFNIKLGGRLVPISTKLAISEQKTIKKYSSKNSDFSLYSIIGVYSCRGFSILHVNLHPVQYSEEKGEIYYYKNIQLTVKTKEKPINNAFRGLSRDYEYVESIVDNPSYVSTYSPETVKRSALDEGYNYVIITNNNLKDSNEEYTFQDLIDFKESKGLSATIVTIEEIMTNSEYEVYGTWGDANPSNPFYGSEITGNLEIFDDKPARIRNFIRYAYTNWGTDYVLLGGDADVLNSEDNIIPLRGLFANESGLPLSNLPDEETDDIPSDVYFACLDGNFNYDCDMHFGESSDRNEAAEVDEADLYSEVWVGRACADSTEEVSNFVMKTLIYEQSGDPYLSDILFVGEDLGSAFYFQYGGDYKDMMEHLVPDQYNLHKFYDRDYPGNYWYPEDLFTEIYAVQPQIINHDGHGNHNYMLKTSGENVRTLTNEKPFFIYSHSCLTGSFDNYNCWSGYQEDDCIAEILTCEIPYGAYACILNARYGLGSEDSPDAPSGAYDESFYTALFSEGYRELGKANHWSKEDNIWRIDDNGYRWCYYQTNLFGDPELRIKGPNTSPNTPTIAGPSNGVKGETYDYTISTTDPEEDDVYYWIEWCGNCQDAEWEGPYKSGEEIVFSHSWETRGDYEVKVKAKDGDGAVSNWATLPVNITRTRSFNIKINEFLNMHPFLSFLLQRILELQK